MRLDEDLHYILNTDCQPIWNIRSERMSKKQWLVLLMLFLTYLLLGASIFYHIESRLEIKRIEEAKRERIEINGEHSRSSN